jgi:Tol biopolymer transport system component
MRYATSFGKSGFFLRPSRQLRPKDLPVLVATFVALSASLLLTGCSSKGKTVAPQNLPPTINAIQLVPPRAAHGDTLTATAVAGDPEGRPLVFLWRATAGTLIDSLGQSIRWKAPLTASTCSLTVRISDEANQVSMTRVIPVGAGYLVIESFPQGATLIMDYEPTQLFTPVTIPDAPAGSYELGVERAPYIYFPGSTSVEVTDGNTTRVRFKLNDGMMSMAQMTVNDCVKQTSWSPTGTSVVCAVEDTVLDYRVLSIFYSPWPDWSGEVIETGVNARYSWGPSWCPTNCGVLFASSRYGVNRIYKVPIDGGQADSVYPGVANYPVWSPDGNKIAFVAAEAGGFSLKVMLASGGVATTVATDVLEDRPSWSPDGSQLAFSKTVGTQPYLFVVSSLGGTPVQVSQVPGTHPSWSPDGKKIAFVSSFDGTENVWIVFIPDAITDSVQGQLTSTGANWPAWRPDGMALCYTMPNPQKGCNTLWIAASPFPF